MTNVNFSQDGDFFSSGGTDGILMIWKSNVRNMDQEFESLSKSTMSRMKSNKKKIEEDSIASTTNKIDKSAKSDKYKVIKPKQFNKPDVTSEKNNV